MSAPVPKEFGGGVGRATELIIDTLDSLQLTEPQKYAALLAAVYTQKEFMLRERMDGIVQALEDLHHATIFEIRNPRGDNDGR